MPTEKAILSAFDTLYACAVGEQGWADAARELMPLVDATATQFFVLELGDEVRVPRNEIAVEQSYEGDPVEFDKIWDSESASIDPRISGPAAKPLGFISYDYRYMDETTWDRHPFYNDYLKPFFVKYHMAARLFEEGSTNVAFAACYKSEHVGENQIKVMSVLVPHLRRAVSIANRLGNLELHTRSVLETIEGASCALVLLNEHFEIVLSNDEFSRIVNLGDGVGTMGKRIHLHASASNRALEMLFGELSDRMLGGPISLVVPVIRPSGRRPYQIGCISLNTTESSLPTSARYLLTISDPDRVESTASILMSEFFDLTPTEERVLEGLLRGLPPFLIAASLNSKETTVRWHVKNLLRRFGVPTQTALVAKVYELSRL